MQATSDKTASANFTQTGKTISNIRGAAGNITNGKNGYAPYYQFGRKDAFRSAEYTTAAAAGTTLVYKQESVKVNATIKNPTTFYAGGSGENYNPYSASFYYNAWNATYTTYSDATTKIDGLEKTVKTVYDPCPVGYTVPPANTFVGLPNDSTLYLPAAGNRSGSNNAVINATTAAFYWLAIAGTSSTGRMWYGYIRVNLGGAWACPMRPVSENVRQH